MGYTPSAISRRSGNSSARRDRAARAPRPAGAAHAGRTGSGRARALRARRAARAAPARVRAPAPRRGTAARPGRGTRGAAPARTLLSSAAGLGERRAQVLDQVLRAPRRRRRGARGRAARPRRSPRPTGGSSPAAPRSATPRRRATPRARTPWWRPRSASASAWRNETMPPNPGQRTSLTPSALAQQLAHGAPVLGVRGDPQVQRAQPAMDEEAVERAGHRADRVLHEVDLLVQLLVAHHDRAADHVGVAAEVLGGGVHHGVGAELERPLHHRRRERVVHGHERVAAARRPRPRCRPRSAAGWSASRPRRASSRGAARRSSASRSVWSTMSYSSPKRVSTLSTRR